MIKPVPENRGSKLTELIFPFQKKSFKLLTFLNFILIYPYLLT